MKKERKKENKLIKTNTKCLIEIGSTKKSQPDSLASLLVSSTNKPKSNAKKSIKFKKKAIKSSIIHLAILAAQTKSNNQKQTANIDIKDKHARNNLTQNAGSSYDFEDVEEEEDEEEEDEDDDDDEKEVDEISTISSIAENTNTNIKETVSSTSSNTNSCSCFLPNQVYESYDSMLFYDTNDDNNNNYNDDLALITEEEKNEYYANKSLYRNEINKRREMLREKFQNFKLNQTFKIRPRNVP